MEITIIEWLNGPGKDACGEARAWLRTLPENSTMGYAWSICHRADWMFWAAGEDRSPLSIENPAWRLAGCAIVRHTCWEALTDERSHNAVEVSERFANNDATSEELSAARSAADSAARSAAWSAADSAAWKAAEGAARCAAWSAARNAAEGAARSAAESAHADILRKFIVNPWGEA